MKVEKDYEELLRLFNRHSVKYCIIGSYAVAFHAKPRYTKDMDILIEPTVENSRRVLKALNEFGFKDLDLSEKDFHSKNKIIQLGYEPVRIDVMTSVPGCSFEEAWLDKVIGDYGVEKVYFIGIDKLIKIKKISDRHLDMEDLDLLLKARKTISQKSSRCRKKRK